MVLFSLLEVGFQGTLFVLRQTYNIGHYLVYGKQKTREEVLEEQLQTQMEKENALLLELRSEIRDLKQSTSTTTMPATETDGRRRSI